MGSLLTTKTRRLTMEIMPSNFANRLQTTDYRKKAVDSSRKAVSKLGFTLIELLVVISIIAILIAVATVSYTNAQQKGRDNKRKSDLKAVQQALELYFQQNGKYPEEEPGGTLRCSGAGAGNGTNWGSAFTCLSITYMNPLPKDPTNTNPYFYFSSAPWGVYVLNAALENTRDPDLPQMSGCQAAPYNWCVKNP